MKKIFITTLTLAATINLIAQKTPVKPATVKTNEKLDRSQMPKAGPAKQIELKQPQTFTLDNGLKVFVVENKKLPRVSFSMQFNVKPFNEADKAGLSDIAGQLIGTATEKLNKVQIDEKVDFLGASLNADANGVSGSCLKKHLNAYMDIYSEVILNSKFVQEELDKIKTKTLSGLASQKKNPSVMASNVKNVLLFGKNHPYGEIATEKSIENISLDDCKQYYDTYFNPAIGYFAIVGDITLDEAKTLVNKYFAGWQKKEIKKTTLPKTPEINKTRVAFVDRPNSVQSTIKIVHTVDVKPGTQEAIKCAVMDDILGGGFSGRLFRNLRETWNFTYGAYSNFKTDEYIGSFEAYADVRASATDSAIKQFFIEINKIRDEKVSEEELQGIKNNLAGKFAISLEQPSTIARLAINTEKYGLPKDFYANYLTYLSKVTVEDIQAMAQQYLKPENCYIIVVGDKDKIAKSLEKYDAEGKIKYYDYYGNDFVPLKKAPEGLTAEKIIENYTNAIGGKKLIDKVKDYTIIYTGTVQGFTLQIKRIQKAPNKYYDEVGSGMMTFSKKVYDGTKGTSSNMQTGTKPMTPEELEEMKTEAVLFNETKFIQLGYKVKLLGIDNINDKDAYKIEIESPKGNKEYAWYDVNTHLMLQTEKSQKTPQGNFTIISQLSDYKEVKGIKFPHKIIIDQGQKLELTAASIEINTKVKDDVFLIK
jgi:predicted Zn-dependent peptidase